MPDIIEMQAFFGVHENQSEDVLTVWLQADCLQHIWLLDIQMFSLQI